MLIINLYTKLTLAILFCLVLAISVSAQDEEDEQDPPTRSITSKDFKGKRKKAKRPVRRKRVRKRTSRQRTRKRITTNSRRRYKHTRRKRYRRKTYKRKKKVVAKKAVAKKVPNFIDEELGITFWRLRPLEDFERDDEDVSLVSVLTDRESGKRENWTAERVNSDTKFVKGDRIRFTIESSRTGYLYIVNREFYDDGTYGTPALIFPTLRTRGGDNRVRAGSLIEIPSATDSISYFTVTPGKENYAGEELAVIITDKPIPGIKLTLRAQRITPEKVNRWLDEWGSTVDIYDAEDGVGIPYSKEEAAAANSTSRDLTQEEPLPQTIYRVKVRENLPIVVPFQMKAIKP